MFRRLAIALALIVPAVVFMARALPLPRHEALPGPPSSSPMSDPVPAQSQRSRQPKQRGVALGLFAEDVSFSYAPLLREVAALGASHVALIACTGSLLIRVFHTLSAGKSRHDVPGSLAAEAAGTITIWQAWIGIKH